MGLITNNDEVIRLRRRVEELARHIEDIACAQDDMTKALVTIHRDIRAMANRINVQLESPLINMNIEKGTISAFERNTIDAEINEKNYGVLEYGTNANSKRTRKKD